MTAKEQVGLYEDRLRLLDSLATHEGWELFQEALRASRDRAFLEMSKTDNAHAAAKHMGAYYTLVNLQDWLSRERLGTETAIENLKLQAENERKGVYFKEKY